MVQGLNKEYIFNENYYKDKYISLIKEYMKKYNIIILSYCIMDNHAHILLYTEQINQLSMFMQNINSKFALYYNKDMTRVGYVFRGRYNSQYINNKKYLLNCLNYIHMNPVNANIIKKPEEYKYSTYNDYLTKTGVVNDIVLNKVFGEEKNYLNVFLNISNKEIEVMDVDRDGKNFEIATEIFLKKNNTTIREIKQNKKMLDKFCTEIIVNKKYRQNKVVKLLKIDASIISKLVKNIKMEKRPN